MKLETILYKNYNITFSNLEKKDLNKVLVLRNQKNVRASSFNNKIISKEEHYKYFENIFKRDNHYYKLYSKNKILGVGYGKNFKEKSCTWGFFVDLDYKSENFKIGSIIKFLLYEKLFSIQNIDKITCEVISDLEWIKNWHIRWGHEEIAHEKSNEYFKLFLKKKNG